MQKNDVEETLANASHIEVRENVGPLLGLVGAVQDGIATTGAGIKNDGHDVYQVRQDKAYDAVGQGLPLLKRRASETYLMSSLVHGGGEV